MGKLAVRLIGAAASLLAATLPSKQALADTFVSTVLSGSDCAGIFSVGGPEICNVTNLEPDLLNGGLKRFSPLIYQRFSDGLQLHSSVYPTISNSEFSFSGLSGSSGFFTYAPGPDDPDVKFWAVQGDTAFRLSWIVADIDAALCTSPLSAACFSAAIALPTGTMIAWQVAAEDGVVPNLAHLSFYGTPSAAVPIPAALSLFAGGLGLLGWMARRKRMAEQLA